MIFLAIFLLMFWPLIASMCFKMCSFIKGSKVLLIYFITFSFQLKYEHKTKQNKQSINQFFLRFLMITNAAIKHTASVMIDTIFALEISALGILAVPLSNKGFSSSG